MIGSRPLAAAAIAAGLLTLLASALVGRAESLENLLRLQDFTARRASSADPSGGNMNMRRVNACQSLTLAEIKGPGIVTHIWFTHMYPSRASLRKLVLRIYFDDLAEPCVEAPLGDFAVSWCMRKSAHGPSARTAGEPVTLYQAPPFPAPFDAVAAEGELKAGAHVLKFTSLEPDKRAKGNRLLLDKVQVIGPGP